MSGVAFVVNGGPQSAMAIRAHAFAAGVPEWQPTLHFRQGSRGAACGHYLRSLRDARPSAIYLLDLTLPAILAAITMRRLTRCRVIVETGDATAALLTSHHRFGRWSGPLLSRYERASLAAADAVVVRGGAHATHLELIGLHASAVIPDGVNMDVFRPADAAEVRARLGLGRQLVVGTVGSLHWNEQLQWTTGLELIDALAVVRSNDVAGLIVGQGSGLSHLRSRAASHGVTDRVRFIDEWQDETALAACINAMDVCLSTQTNNLIGQVRTTGKLPLYLACGRFVLATRVGEAARVLPKGMLLDYSGDLDLAYPQRLASRLDEIAGDRTELSAEVESRKIAAAEFDYRVLVQRLAGVLAAVVPGRQQAA